MDKHTKFLFIRLSLHFFAVFLFLLFSCILFVSKSLARQELTGILQNYTAFQITNEYELVAARNRIRGQIYQSLSFGDLYAEIDLIDSYTHNREFEMLPREIYADWFTTHYDIRIGKQKIIWGKSSGAFVNDILTPSDYREFLTQEVKDLRIGLNSLNVQRYFESNYLQLIVAPARQQNRLPDPDSPWFPVQQPSAILSIDFSPSDTKPVLSEVQLAARFAWRPTDFFDADIMIYHWAHPMPAFAIQFQESLQGLPDVTLHETYKTSPMAGFSITWQATDRWIFSAEGLYVYERVFTFLPISETRLEEVLNDPAEASQLLQEFNFQDDDYLLSKPWIQQMLGLQTTFMDATVGIQGYLELILNYENRVLPQRLFTYATGFVQKSFFRDRLSTSINGRYNFLGKDFWVQGQAGYDIRDGFEILFGTHVFGGTSVSPFYGHLSFEQFRDYSFLFVQTSIYF